MKFLVYWIRNLFCRHNWKYENHILDLGGGGRQVWVCATCTDCGWYRSYPKIKR